ncbi:MAG: D-alanine-D-alanine ligase [Myxococcota bacterium]|jgi:D-alanine-D-alanine ligase
MSEERPKVAVVVGGESGEHAVSLMSGAEVAVGIDPTRWDPFLVRIERDGAWCFLRGLDVKGLAERLSVADGIKRLLRLEPDVVFPVMHGPYGEDGRFQSLLELLHLPYVGSPPGASSLAMNKARARDVLTCAGHVVARGEELRRGEHGAIEAPCVVKPMRLGSSVGLMVVKTQEALNRALMDAFEYDDRVLVESFVAGIELTAGVLESANGDLEALPLIEIRPLTREFFDYEAKYTPGATDEICPAPVSDAVRNAVQALALSAHNALGCRGMSRTDFIVREDGTPVTIETNTIPGMTQTSLLPQAAAEAGISFTELLDRLLERALNPER